MDLVKNFEKEIRKEEIRRVQLRKKKEKEKNIIFGSRGV